MKFSEINGLQETKAKLIRSVQSNHIAHALMLASQEGGAGLQMALAFATYINCENKGENDSCGECASCHKMSKLIHPDVSFFYPVSGTKKVQKPTSDQFIKEWRSFVLEHPYGTWIDWGNAIGAENKQLLIPKEESKKILTLASMKSFEGEYKIIFIWLPEYMNLYSANALLKVLEEPPQKTVFLLLTENIEKILLTIISRTQVLRIPSYGYAEMKEILLEKGIDSSKAETISQIAMGNISDALTLSEQVDDTRHQVIREWLLDCYKFNNLSLIERADEFQKLGRESQKAFFRLTLSILRETIAASSGDNSILNIPENQKTFIYNLTQKFGWERMAAISEEINRAYYHLERNLYPKIVFLDTSLLISSIFRR